MKPFCILTLHPITRVIAFCFLMNLLLKEPQRKLLAGMVAFTVKYMRTFKEEKAPIF